MKVSYTITPFLRSELEAIDQIRNSYLIRLIHPAIARQNAWNAKVDRTYNMLTARNNKIRKTRLDQIFRETTPKNNLPEIELLAYNYKKALDYVEENWTIESAHVSETEVKKLQHILKPGQPQKMRDIKSSLEFIQSTPEHPVTQAALAYEMLLPLFDDREFAVLIATLTSYIFLYKKGFDMRRQLVLEEYFTDTRSHLNTAEKAYESGNLSPFLDQFVNGIRAQAEKVIQTFEEQRKDEVTPKAFFKLNDRQKHIITLLEEPGARLSNKNVQKHYDISQVTASRDLAKLVHLGLIRPHGKGRSVYYTISNS